MTVVNSIKKGETLYISQETISGTLTQTDYEALTWVEVTGVASMPEMGHEANDVTRNLIKSNFTQHGKGYADGGSTSTEVALDTGSAGQALITDAAHPDYNFEHGFKIEGNDKLNPTGTNSIAYSGGIVLGKKRNGGEGETFTSLTYAIAFNRETIFIDPTAGV